MFILTQRLPKLTSVVDKIRINPGNFTNETDFLDKKYEKEVWKIVGRDAE